jgi:hypothetical protein
MLIIAVPGGIDEYFRELHLTPDHAATMQIARRYGIEIL